jgi:hypothetical protein
VIVIATLGAPRRDHRGRRARSRAREVAPEPAPAAVTTGRATVISVADRLGDAIAARAWLARAGEPELDDGLRALDRLLYAHRLVSADPTATAVAREHLIAARIGWGAGEEVAEGQWSQARELAAPDRPADRPARRRVPAPEARLAAVLAGREHALVCEELVLRARSDLDAGRAREAALGVVVALDAAIAELSAEPSAAALVQHLDELRDRREPTAAAAQAALAESPSPAQRDAVAATVVMIEAALRARATGRAR